MIDETTIAPSVEETEQSESRPTFELDGRTFVYFKTSGWRLRMLTSRGVQWILMNTHAQADIALVMQSQDVKQRITDLVTDCITKTGLQEIMDRQPTMADCIAEWRDHLLRHEGLQPTTIEPYVYKLGIFARRFDLLTLPVSCIKENHIIEMVNGLEKNYRFAYRKQMHIVLRRFLDWCSVKGYCLGNIARIIRGVNTRALPVSAKEPKYKRPWTDAEFQQCVAYIDRLLEKKEKKIRLITSDDVRKVYSMTELERYRDLWRNDFGFKVSMYLARYAGLRMYDCVNLEWDSILPNEFNDNGKNLLVYTHKRDRRLCIPMPEQIKALMPKIIEQRNDERWVWRELHRWYLKSPTMCSARFRDYVKRSGLDSKKNCFHGLRVTYAYACRDAGLSTDHIRQLLTHLDAETTALYLGGPAQYPRQPEYAAVPPATVRATQTSPQNEQG